MHISIFLRLHVRKNLQLINYSLKKKIKGKKHGKADEDDLFDPEQLEKLKRELEEKRKAEAA